MPTRLIPFQQGMKLGFGYDLLAGSPLTTPAVQGTVSSIAQAQGQDVISSFITITDLDTLHQELGVNVDAGGSYFGVSADVKVNYAKECNISQFATHVMVRVSVQDAFENFDAPVLTDGPGGAKTLLANTGDVQSRRFRERFGDLFIDGLQKGGEYFATWEIVSVDQSVRETIANKVEAAFRNPVAAAHLDVDVESAKTSTSSHTEVHVHVLQKGAIDHTDQTMAEVLAKAHDFPPSVAGNNAAPFAVSIADYKTLDLPNDAFNFLDIQNQRDVLEEHARKRFEFLTLRNSISYIRQHPNDFVGVDDALLASQLQKVTDAINKMEAEASACLRNPGACNFTPFDVSDFPLPQPRPGVAAPTTIGSFQGTWRNTNADRALAFVRIGPTVGEEVVMDSAHERVVGLVYRGVDDFGTTSIFTKFNDIDKTLDGAVIRDEINATCQVTIGPTPGTLIVAVQMNVFLDHKELEGPSTDTFVFVKLDA